MNVAWMDKHTYREDNAMGYQKLVFDKESVFLVTGGAGFIGSNLCEAILNMGYTVRCLDNLSTGKYENIEPFTQNPRFTFIKGDIRNLDTCMEATKGVDYVLNQAAWGSVPRSIEMPLGHTALYTACRTPHPRASSVHTEIAAFLPVLPSSEAPDDLHIQRNWMHRQIS